MKLLTLLLAVILLLLLRKLFWCLRWLWRYYHGKELPEPISILPQRSGRVFQGHLHQTPEPSAEPDGQAAGEAGPPAPEEPGFDRLPGNGREGA